MVKRWISRVAFAGLALAGVLLLSGCADVGQSPLAPGTAVRAGKPAQNTGTSTTTATTTTSTSSTGQPLYTKSASGWFSPGSGGSLNVKFANNYGSWTDVRLKSATFQVAPGAIAAKVLITMDVTTGYTIDDVNVQFGPSGLTFNPEGTLTLVFWGGSKLSEEELRLREAQGYHITSDGYISTVTQETDTQGNAYYIIAMKVPGFSRFSVGGNDYVPEADPGW